MEKTETAFTNAIVKGDRKRGMNDLRIPEIQKNENFVYLRDGWYLGALFPAILTIIIYLGLNPEEFHSDLFTRITRVYGGFVVFMVFLWLLGVNFIVWKKLKINYIFIFELDPRHHIDIPNYFEFVAILSCLVGYSYVAFLFNLGAPTMGPEYHPIILLGVFLLVLFFPFPIFYMQSRFWLIKELWKIATAPFYKVEFADFMLGDQICSLVYVILSLQYTICLYLPSSSPGGICDQHQGVLTIILASLPSWFRLMQCFRRYRDLRASAHLLNAGKYFSAIMVVVCSGLNRIFGNGISLSFWIVAAVFSLIYSSLWDIMRDWSLFQKGARHKLLRNSLFYPWPWVYYVAIPLDVVLRSAWVVTLSENPANPNLRDFFLALAEVYRRFQWNFFRLENEHVNNVGKFRAVKEVPLPATFLQHTDALDAGK